MRFAVVLMLGLACLVALPKAWADDPFSVSGLPVDASAASATVAQNIAINEGRGRAWTILYRRLTKASDWPRQPQLDEASLQRLVRNYVVANERRSTTRFVANMTYIFNADAVRRLLRTQNIPYVDMEAKPVLVIAMAPGYAPRSPWASIWNNPKFAGGSPPMLPPFGDPVDAQSLTALNFATAQWQDVEPAASRVHATEAFLVQASPAKGQIVVALKELAPQGSIALPNVVVPVKPGTPGPVAYGSAADAAATAIVDAWKAHAAIDFSKRLRLTAEIKAASLSEWGAIMQKLATVPTITDVAVQAMDIGEARVSVTYAGTAEQLQAFVAQAGLDMENDGGTWQIAVAQQPALPPPPR